ncbi:DUF3285 domain-containing protein [Prochlorococcus marinus]|uniref:DUF3285 domain-containing protein n=1 Tax=Prochlorococcus marinus TaxID=1219 RepID=UPI0022B397D6|nr:DUF3285 domain-containing protein [Prochlorococcus marinus]
MNHDSSETTSNKRTPPPSFIKLAMKNMVRKGGQSLIHFGFTAIGFIAFIVFIAVLGRPSFPH